MSIREQIANQVKKMGYTGCANQIRANLKARENALMALKNKNVNLELIEKVKKLLPEQTERQNQIYQLFNIELGNELFHMYAGFTFIGAKQVSINKDSAEYKYNKIKQQLSSMVRHSEELDSLFEDYEQTGKELFLLYAEDFRLNKSVKSRDQYMELLIPLYKQMEELEIPHTAAKIALANYLMEEC